MDMKKLLAGAAILTFASTASAFKDFTIDEGSVPGAFDQVLVGDKLNGGYSEILTINANLTFDTIAVATLGQLFANDGNDAVASQMSCSPFSACYNMYAVFSASGTAGLTSFTGSSGSFDLYIDPNQDTDYTFGASATDALTWSGDADDYKIAFASDPSSMVGFLGDPGAFDFVWEDFTLTAEGEEYFIEPDPFHFRVNVDGDFDQVTTDALIAAILAGGGTVDGITGDVSAVYVPEPGSLALFAGSLLGLGYASRRRKAKA